VLILQHPSEQKQALATVPILQKCLSPLQVWVGEDFFKHEGLSELVQNKEQCRVLFPSEQSIELDMAVGTGQIEMQNSDSIKTLIVLDGTWRKAKKIWHLNAWLHDFPAITLKNAPASQYVIRSSSVEGGVSTLEAITLFCNYLSNSTQFDALSKPFKAMIDMQIESMGEEVFNAHYGKE
jgi:DTW domain-containing protein YfiP